MDSSIIKPEVGEIGGGVVGAGESARREAAESRRHADELRRAAAEMNQRANSFDRGGLSELRTAELLGSLTAHGYMVLHDRAWPSTRHANIDHVVIGASGVFIVDTKNWSSDVTATGSRLFRGQADAREELDKVRAQAEAVREVMAGIGLPPIMVHPVIALHGRDMKLLTVDGVWVIGAEVLPRALLAHAKALTQWQVEQIVGAIVAELPPATERSALRGPTQVATTSNRATPNAAAPPPDALFNMQDLEDDALEAASKKPLKDWMTFLHPSQAQYVKRALGGPGRITGPAGTGKTVVALHRLAYLAETGANRLLYATFVSTVSTVVQAAFAELTPHVAGRVEFIHLHRWAMKFLRERRLPCDVASSRAMENFHNLAFERSGQQHTLLGIVGQRTYWRDEIDTVIRGRGIDDLAEYLSLDRAGRGTKLGHRQRSAVWRVAEEYNALLRRHDLVDWNDVLRLARDEVRRRPPEPAYDVVVLDEAQDLPLLGAELVHALVGDKPNGLLLVGDDQQRVFPGGFRLIEAGIDIRNRSVRLDVNYRNTRQVIDFATQVLDPNDEVLLEDSSVGAPAKTVRTGPLPVIISAANVAAHDRALLEAIRDARAKPALDPSIVVLHERKDQCKHYLRYLNSHDIPAIALHDWDGKAFDAVLVGTPKRAKGLEFNQVFMPNVDTHLLKDAPTAALSEYEARRRREAFVGMTRTRSHLWIGTVDTDYR